MSPSGRKSRVEKTELRTRRLLQELISLRCPALYTLILKRENPCPLINNESPATPLKPDFLMEPNFAKLVKAILRLAGGGYPTVFPSEYRQERPRHARVPEGEHRRTRRHHKRRAPSSKGRIEPTAPNFQPPATTCPVAPPCPGTLPVAAASSSGMEVQTVARMASVGAMYFCFDSLALTPPSASSCNCSARGVSTA